MTHSLSFPAERREGKGTHPRRVCGAKRVFRRADARLMGRSGLNRLWRFLNALNPSDRFAILAGDDTLSAP
jgi:hypothetical protein